MCAKFATDLRMRRDFIHAVPSKLELVDSNLHITLPVL